MGIRIAAIDKNGETIIDRFFNLISNVNNLFCGKSFKACRIDADINNTRDISNLKILLDNLHACILPPQNIELKENPNFLQRYRNVEISNNLSDFAVIDAKDWDSITKYLHENPDIANNIIKYSKGLEINSIITEKN